MPYYHKNPAERTKFLEPTTKEISYLSPEGSPTAESVRKALEQSGLSQHMQEVLTQDESVNQINRIIIKSMNPGESNTERDEAAMLRRNLVRETRKELRQLMLSVENGDHYGKLRVEDSKGQLVPLNKTKFFRQFETDLTGIQQENNIIQRSWRNEKEGMLPQKESRLVLESDAASHAFLPNFGEEEIPPFKYGESKEKINSLWEGTIQASQELGQIVDALHKASPKAKYRGDEEAYIRMLDDVAQNLAEASVILGAEMEMLERGYEHGLMTDYDQMITDIESEKAGKIPEINEPEISKTSPFEKRWNATFALIDTPLFQRALDSRGAYPPISRTDSVYNKTNEMLNVCGGSENQPILDPNTEFISLTTMKFAGLLQETLADANKQTDGKGLTEEDQDTILATVFASEIAARRSTRIGEEPAGAFYPETNTILSALMTMDKRLHNLPEGVSSLRGKVEKPELQKVLRAQVKNDLARMMGGLQPLIGKLADLPQYRLGFEETNVDHFDEVSAGVQRMDNLADQQKRYSDAVEKQNLKKDGRLADQPTPEEDQNRISQLQTEQDDLEAAHNMYDREVRIPRREREQKQEAKERAKQSARAARLSQDTPQPDTGTTSHIDAHAPIMTEQEARDALNRVAHDIEAETIRVEDEDHPEFDAVRKQMAQEDLIGQTPEQIRSRWNELAQQIQAESQKRHGEVDPRVQKGKKDMNDAYMADLSPEEARNRLKKMGLLSEDE